MKKFVHAAIAAFAIATLPVAATATTIGFDALPAGDDQGVPVMQFTESGYTFQLEWRPTGNNPNRPARSHGPAIFDTTCAAYGVRGCAADPDLELSDARQGENGVSGNVLILQDLSRDFYGDNDQSIVIDDEADAGSIIFTLLSGPAFNLVGASALDDIRISFFTRGDTGSLDNRFGQVGNTNTSFDNATFQTTFATQPLIRVGDSFRVRYSGSGALDSLVLAPVPLPAGAVLLIGALGGLALMRRRSRA